MRPERDSYAWKAARDVRLVVGVHRCGRGARGYCRHLEQCCIKVRLLAAQLHHNWRTTRPHSATRCASTCETVPQVCAEPAVTIAHQSVKSTCPSRKVCASHFVKPERRRTSPARSPNSSASSCEDRGAAAGRASGVRHGQTDESAAPPWCGASRGLSCVEKTAAQRRPVRAHAVRAVCVRRRWRH